MSLSKKHKAYKANGGTLSFAEWVVKYDRLVVARAARGSAPKVRKAVKAHTFERVSHRVDCMGELKNGMIVLGADKADGRKVARICGGKIVNTYTSKRGERVQIQTRTIDLTGLVAAGFTPKGF